MDAARFDAFARAITTSASRRATIAGALRASLAVVLLHLGSDDTDAKRKKRPKKKCRRGKKKCGKRCVDLATNGANCGFCGYACPSGSCVNGACTCETQEECVGTGSCACVSRLQGGAACSATPGAIGPCDEDADCPLGSFCAAPGFRCAARCLP